MDEKDILRRLKEEGERIEIPEELRPERIEKMLESVKEMQKTWEGDETIEQQTLAPKNRKWHRYTRRIAAAAAVLICIGGAYGTSQMVNSGNKSWKSDSAAESVQENNGSDPTLDAVEQTEEDGASFGAVSVAKVGDMYTRAEDYEEIYDKLDEDREKWYEKIWNSFDIVKGESDGSSAGAVKEDMAEEAAPEASNAPSELGSDYSRTNLMTAGVDESDIVKTDGKYIYMLRDNRITITDIRNGVLKEAAAFRPPMNSASGRVLEMYVDEEQLIVIAQEEKTNMSASDSDSSDEDAYSSYDVYTMDSESGTTAYIYDISNPAEPKLRDTVEQDGTYHTSRKIGNILYLFTDYILDLPDGRKRDAITEDGAKDWIPSINEETVPADCIYLPESGRNSLLVSSADVTKRGKIIDTKMIVSNYVDIYVSNSSIFLYEADYSSSQSYTRIAKFALEKGMIQGVDAASVRGEINDAFAINEYQGYLRVLTTDWQDGNDINEVYVLDSDMKLTGEISGIAPGERVYSARFLKETGYFVTYRNTDPLFTVDFSDPENPRITGELKVTGFSEYLHFWGEDKLLGIGYETDPDTGRQLGIKLSMFDISDPSNVWEESKLVLKGADYSPALYDYKCVLADKEKNLIGFAVEEYDTSWDEVSYQVYSYENGGFVRKMVQTLEDYYDISGYRGLYAGSRFYLAGAQKIQVYDMENEFKQEEQATE